jgi:hypothetical protein
VSFKAFESISHYATHRLELDLEVLALVRDELQYSDSFPSHFRACMKGRKVEMLLLDLR